LINTVYFSLGSLSLPYDKTGAIFGQPQRVFQPYRCGVPSRCIGWTITSWKVGNIELLAAPVPVEVFSEVALSFGMHFPRFDPQLMVKLELRSPPRPRPVHFSQWRRRSQTLRRGLRVKPPKSNALQVVRRGLWLRQLGRPWWIPPPLPPAFAMAFYGEGAR
jgi:hypothetical protein